MRQTVIFERSSTLRRRSYLSDFSSEKRPGSGLVSRKGFRRKVDRANSRVQPCDYDHISLRGLELPRANIWYRQGSMVAGDLDALKEIGLAQLPTEVDRIGSAADGGCDDGYYHFDVYVE